MKARTTAIGLAAALALALPVAAPGAEGESVVPPENSAATQYTEAIPTAGGDREAHGGGKKPSPAKVLGAANAKELESKGQAGREVARVAAETAPPTSAPADSAPVQGEAPGDDPGGQTSAGGSSKPGGGDSGGGAASQPNQPQAPANPPQKSTELPSGSSGLGEILAEATGSSSSGDLGLLLPLLILAAIAWSIAYFWRQRRPAE